MVKVPCFSFSTVRMCCLSCDNKHLCSTDLSAWFIYQCSNSSSTSNSRRRRENRSFSSKHMNNKMIVFCGGLCYFSLLMDHLHLHSLWARSEPVCAKNRLQPFWLNVEQERMLRVLAQTELLLIPLLWSLLNIRILCIHVTQERHNIKMTQKS